MEGRDRRLHDVGSTPVQRESTIERRPAFGDLRGVPSRAVLVGQQHDLVVVETSLAASVEQQHQREHALHLRLVGHQLGDRPAEHDRLVGQVAAGGRARVALVEDQVDDGKHRDEPVGQQVIGRHAERDAGRLDLALRTREALAHRRFRHEERACDLVGGQAAEGAQGERDLRLDRQRRMAAHEDQLEPLVGERRGCHRLLLRLRGEQPRLRGEDAIASDAIDSPVPRGAHEPRAGVRRHAVTRPSLRCDGEGLLCGFLGEIDVAEEADQGCEHVAPTLAEDLLERRFVYHSTIGRTSTAPPSRAAGTRDASSIAASRSSASNSR